MNKKIKSFWQTFRQSIGLTLVMMVMCGLLFPLTLTGLASLIFPHQASGSTVEVDGKVIGVENVGQEFTQNYFLWGRPSAYHYNVYKEDESGKPVYLNGEAFIGLSSGSANYAPSNPNLTNRVSLDMAKFLELNPSVEAKDIPSDLLTASGSGLDPHISLQAAMIQVPRIEKASGISANQIEQIISHHTEKQLFGLLGEETVNVLLVNKEIASTMNQ
ncbi:potassium-transporting ATPase subunit KdpC [Facklamia miroungae]|uniref:Potassium-transporting ATPase KdpC subunit n=1 Tax=Facklamia miroungae TaxID=120956 RepID=A0A1G7SS71_9LACT|nr:potassium-transporting ATPase subunit KdpC [Facklamia miroungae]NKZ29562.1 potassium-transporting ATPase subunit KdpC [Facklamia miroungae]SDG25742.1 K+-transporting ATPase ATPase C chain [Facklamia miroungae]